MIKRRKTRQIKIGNVKVGGDAPISIQSMTKVQTSDIKAVVSQIKRLENCGCEIIRVAIKNFEDAEAVKYIKKKIKIPLVCDIHFDYRLALQAIEMGADKIRLNPGNIKKKEEITAIIKSAKRRRIPIRIGVNSGSISRSQKSEVRSQKNLSSVLCSLSSELVNSTMNYIKIFEWIRFHDIIISIKTSDVQSTVEAYRKIAKLCDYPLHLGVTASGTYDQGIVKSSIGIGAILLDGIGDTIRVSLAADPVEEVVAAKRILSSLGIRNFGPNIIACPTCGRCQVDLVKIVKELRSELSAIRYPLSAKRPLTIAIMGCEVNGPGEAMGADLGVAFGKNSGMIFKNGKILKKVSTKNAVKELLKEIKSLE